MSKRALKTAVFGQIYANVQRARTLASDPSRKNDPRCVPPPVAQVYMPVERYMLNEQAYIREIGYSH